MSLHSTREMGYHTYRLPNGQTLCYQLFGEPNGYPLCYCHGFPGSRLEARLAHEAGRALHVCVIAVDRPGFGRSDFKRGRQMRDWVESASNLMDFLGHARFSVLGISGGGPYAMLMGEHLDHRIYRVGIVGGLGSLAGPGSEQVMGRAQRALIDFARAYPKSALFLYQYGMGRFMKRFPKLTLSILNSRAPAVDRTALAKPEIESIFLSSIREAFFQGGRGPAWEFYLFTHQWQANPVAVKSETFLWHGDLDVTVPVSMGHFHAQQIPRCHAEFLPREGHFSLPLNHIERILSTLIY